MNQRAKDAIISRIAGAKTAGEQFEAIAALDAFDKESAARHQEGREVSWADTVVTATLSPVSVHERSTIETDWLGEVTSSVDGNQIIAEAAGWFRRVSAAVKADPEEFGEQAKGIARRTASQYGEGAPGAEASFLDYVMFLHRREAASGLDQVQQLVDSHENPKQTGLPQDVFDTFGPPVHPINQGVTGTETSERNPLINEIEQEGAGGSTETHHDTTQQFSGPAPVQARPGVQGTTASSRSEREEHGRSKDGGIGDFTTRAGICPDCHKTMGFNDHAYQRCGLTSDKTGSLVTEPLFTPTVGISHTATLADFAEGGRFYTTAMYDHKEGCPSFRTLDESDCTCAQSHARSCDMFNGGRCDCHVKNSKRVQAASGLPQVQQIVDAQNEAPAPTPLPEEVAFPWDLEEAPEIDERSDHKAKRQAALAYLRGLTLQPTASLTEVQRLQVAAFRKHADEWSQSGPQFHGPGVANNPGTTPEGTGGTYDAGYSEGRSDWQTDGAPTYADASSSVPPFVQGHSTGYGDAARQDPTAPGGATPGQLPPGAGGFGEYQTHAASLQTTAHTTADGNTMQDHQDAGHRVMNSEQNQHGYCVDCNQALPYRTAGQVQAVKLNCANCGRQDSHFNMTIRGNGSGQQAWCTNCKPATNGQDQSFRGAPATMSGSENLMGRHRAGKEEAKTSSLFVTAVEMADPDFAKAYKYASTWTPGKPLVRRHASKVSFEAGLYAGISDNPGNQDAWTAAHTAAATRYKDKGFLDRVALHTSFTSKVAKAMPSLRTQAGYVKSAADEGYNDCPNHEGQAYHKSTGDCSCGSNHHRWANSNNPGGKKTAATSTDLDTMSPSTSPAPTGQTPINGPGTPPPMQGGVDPARSGGPSPYNGAEPYGTPAVSAGPAAHGQPTAIDDRPGAPVDQAAYQHLSPQTHAFRRRVQASLLTQEGVPPFARSAAEQKYPVCNGCGEAFSDRETANQAHGKSGCGSRDNDNTGYRMVPESEAW